MPGSSLPENWIAGRLGDVVDYGSTSKVEPADIADNEWVLELEDIEKESSKILQRLAFAARASKSTKNRFKKGDVLYGKLRPYLSKVVIADADGVCTTEIIPLNGGKYLDNRYLFYWLRHPAFLDYASDVSHGLNMPRLGTKQGQAAPFVLAPLAEQKQIANKLDELLAQVDSIKTRLDAIPAILKRFRQSVLAAAVSGLLTEDWRDAGDYSDVDEYYDAPTAWERMSLGSIVELVTSGSRGWAKYYSDAGCVFIRSQNINTDRLELDDAAYVSLPHSTEGKRTKVQESDLLVTITGANVTKCARVAIDIGEAYVSQHVALIRLFKPESSVFVHLVLIAPNAGRRQLVKSAYGGGKPGLNLQNLRDISLAMPSDIEQVEIVKRTYKAFSFADQIEQHLTEAQTRINKLTQSILAKAFCGELTADWREQHPELISGEHSAEALLARIQAARAKLEPKKRLRRKKVAST